MSTKENKKNQASTKGGSLLNLTTLPQVNLVPAERAEAKAFASVKRTVLIFFLVGLLAIGGFAFFKSTQLTKAEEDLAAEQARYQQVLADIEKYKEVTPILEALTAQKQAHEIGFSTEVYWAEYLSAIAAQTPAGVLIQSYGLETSPPNTATESQSFPMAVPSIGTVTLSLASPEFIDSAVITAAYNGIPGFSDAVVTSTSLNPPQDGGTGGYYTASVTININTHAFANRFAAESSEGSE